MASPFMQKGPCRKRLKRYDFNITSPMSVEKHHMSNSNDSNLLIPEGPVFYATQQDFEKSPTEFINKIRPIAQKYGICKIVPPKNWNPPFALKMDSKKKFQTKEQLLHRIQEGISFGDGDEYTISDYLKHSHEKVKNWHEEHYADTNKVMNPCNIEKDYWDIIESLDQEYYVEYGNDVDTHVFGSGFLKSERGRCLGGEIDVEKINLPEPTFGTDDYYKETYWNLNNIPCCDESILRHVKIGINGINVPWLYFGSIFATFCYHTEDNDFYSFNYHHYGAPKVWYGVPGNSKDAEGMEKVFKSFMSTKMRDAPELLYHITTMFNPRLLKASNVPVYRIIQHPGEFVLTFPRAFHGGFSLGPNIGEAVNFATHDWIPFGAAANERYRNYARPAVFSHDRLAFTMAHHLPEQKTYETCRLLAQELKRINDEEMSLRHDLVESGVRDLSNKLRLPANRLDQIDERSTDYDEKRLCHACKHICFFSCVACECSESKVSCLRHSHFMCRCIPQKKYLMIWTSEEDMKKTLDEVERFSETLKAHEKSSPLRTEDQAVEMPAPGSRQDLEDHHGYIVDVSSQSPLIRLPITGQCPLELFRKKTTNLEARDEVVTVIEILSD